MLSIYRLQWIKSCGTGHSLFENCKFWTEVIPQSQLCLNNRVIEVERKSELPILITSIKKSLNSEYVISIHFEIFTILTLGKSNNCWYLLINAVLLISQKFTHVSFSQSNLTSSLLELRK